MSLRPISLMYATQEIILNETCSVLIVVKVLVYTEHLHVAGHMFACVYVLVVYLQVV